MKIGDSVRVKSGIMDPEFEKYDMAGWQGRIVAIDTTEKEFIEIAWDSITLGLIPAEYIERSIDDYWDFSSIWLNNNEVELIEPRDTMNEVKNKLLEIREHLGYITPEEQEKNILKILKRKDLSVNRKNQDRYYDYLEEHITYPCVLIGSEDFSWEEPYLFGIFDEKEYELLKKERPSYTDQYKLIRLGDIIDDLRGILVEVRRISDKKVFVLPLWDLKTVDRKNKNHQLISDYSYWMSNYK
ncbi:MAG: calcium-binding protein [Kosmotogaceae bacterium]